MFGAELSYMIKQDEESFAEEKHLLEKLNISTHQKKWREATENLVKEGVKITDNVQKDKQVNCKIQQLKKTSTQTTGYEQNLKGQQTYRNWI